MTLEHPVLYSGTWTGEFKKAWSQNPAWIIYYLLTNKEHGLGIPSQFVDKWSFYSAAQYYDDVNPETGRFNASIKNNASGGNEHNPRGKYNPLLEKPLIGSPNYYSK